MDRINVLFRADAGAAIGLGHLQRCLSLAMALRDFDAACLFLTNDDPIVTARIKSFSFEGFSLHAAESWGVDDLGHTLAIASSYQCDVIVVDSERKGPEYLGRLRSAGFFVCAIEDMAPHPFPCQLVVNGNAHAHQLRYDSSSGDTRFLLGPEYSILRREFWNISSREVRDVVRNVLITMGGADADNLMPRVLSVLGQLPATFEVIAIIGPFFKNLGEIKIAVDRSKRPVRLVHAPHSVRALMLEADLAVSEGGQTLYELACAGCPAVAVQMALNQEGQVQVFSKSGSLRVAGCSDDVGIVAKIGDEVRSLLLDSKARSAMSAAGQRLVDGQGALRVAKTILAEGSRSREKGLPLR